MFIVFSGEFHGIQVEQFLFNVYSLELLNLGCLYFSIKAKATETENYPGAKVVFLGYLPKGLFPSSLGVFLFVMGKSRCFLL